MTHPAARHGRVTIRAALVAVVALVLALPAGIARARETPLDAPPRFATEPLVEPGGGPEALPDEPDEPGAPPDGPPGAPPDDLVPSIHYRDAEAHAADVLDLEPGERVRVPFTPRTDDTWEVDGRAPRALPAGHANGREMRDADDGSAWAAGVPRDVASPRHFAAQGAAPADALATGEPDGSTVQPASIAVAPPAAVTPAAPVGTNGLRREVFGFLPYWELADQSTVLDWRTLSTVAYFSVGCTSSGSLLKRNPDGSTTSGWAGWTSQRMTSIIDAAHQHQSRVVLTVSCFAWGTSGAQVQAALLGSATARATLARQAAAAVRDRGADGINLDFEPIAAGYADEFTLLVRRIRTELNAIAPGYQLTFDTMGSIGNQPIAEATAPGGADAIFIMGYDYRTASSSAAGSIAPLTGPIYDLTDTVKAYTAKVSASKLILGVPYYGRAWSTASTALHARTLAQGQYGASAAPTYAEAIELLERYGRRWDSVEGSPWTAYQRETCTAQYGCVTAWRELYADDAGSLRLRYDLVNRSGLRGAGMWALGYDDARPELRAALADKFLTDKTAPLTGVVTLTPTQRDEGFRVAWTSYDDSTVTGYDVQVSTGGGGWWTWLAGTTLTSSIFLGLDGRTYAFRVRARDVHGNVSAWAALPVTGVGAPGSIVVGGWGTVVTDGLRLRTGPSVDASIMATFADGDAVQVIGGPVGADGYTWYQVAGPVRQWSPVDALQVGGWVAASGAGVTHLAPRAAVYATRIDAGITHFQLNYGGDRALTPNGDGQGDELHLAWTNERAFDSLSLRLHRADGTVAGSVALGRRGVGAQAFDWDGRIGGSLVPAGTYVVQLQGIDGGTTFSAPSASPVSAGQLARFGIVVGKAAPTSVVSFRSTPGSPTAATSLRLDLSFGGPVKGLARDDLSRSGTATGCVIGNPTGSGASWSFALTGCSVGTVVVQLRADAVTDAVSNWGPSTRAIASLVIDRTAPSTGAPRAWLRDRAALATTALATGVPGMIEWQATDAGGAGLGTYEVARSIDGAPFKPLATSITARSLDVWLVPGHTYRFEVRARDKAGNVGGWDASGTLRVYLPQQSSSLLAFKGTWATATDPQFSGGTARSATVAGSSLTHTFTGKAIGWVSTLRPGGGSARVYIDGALLATVDTQAAAFVYRRVVFKKSWTVSGNHTLRILVLGTSGHPRVDVDALIVLR